MLIIIIKNLQIKNFTNLHFLEENGEFVTMENTNNIIGKYLLSLFYYKDVILDNTV